MVSINCLSNELVIALLAFVARWAAIARADDFPNAFSLRRVPDILKLSLIFELL
jgi:hypothetical protein